MRHHRCNFAREHGIGGITNGELSELSERMDSLDSPDSLDSVFSNNKNNIITNKTTVVVFMVILFYTISVSVCAKVMDGGVARQH